MNKKELLKIVSYYENTKGLISDLEKEIKHYREVILSEIGGKDIIDLKEYKVLKEECQRKVFDKKLAIEKGIDYDGLCKVTSYNKLKIIKVA